MSLLGLRCARFRALLNDSQDRDLSSKERSFVQDHRARCEGCRRAQDSLQTSLNMLRSAAIDAAPANNFDKRLIRRLHVQTVKDGFSYWSPALVGCTLAFFAVFTALDLLSVRGPAPSYKLQSGQASIHRHYPRFELHTPPHFVR